MQSKVESAVEISFNIGSGFVIAWILTMFVLPYFGFVEVTVTDGFWITVIFTTVSLLRSYIWRRYFNKRASSDISKAMVILYNATLADAGIPSCQDILLTDFQCNSLPQSTKYSYDEIRSNFGRK